MADFSYTTLRLVDVGGRLGAAASMIVVGASSHRNSGELDLAATQLQGQF
jgi:hypothetical protein